MGKLYKVRHVNQESAEEVWGFFVATGLGQLEEEIADILEVELVEPFEDLTPDKSKSEESQNEPQ